MPHPPRIAVRALIMKNQQLLLVNAYPDGQSDLWCAPGGGVEAHQMPWDGPPFAFAGDSVQGVDRKTACCGGGPRDGNPRRVKGEKDD